MPSALSLGVTACLVTGLVVMLGVVFTPETQQPRGRQLARAAVVSAPREEAAQAAPAVLDRPAPQKTERAVVLKEKPEPRKPEKKARKKPPPPPPEAEFVLSTFNVLGSSHTTGRDGMDSGVVRVRRAATLFAHHGVDVVGLQELQGDQYREFQRVAGGTYDVYPGTSAGPLGIENSLAWRTSEWAVESAQTIQIPYFDGNLRPMPYVLLRHIETGRKAWFANFHNPASNPKRGNNDGWRARALGIEIALAVRLRAETGYPVFITGDLNDREVAFCRMTGGAPMIAANGGSNVGGACDPPPYPMPVDWIFGSDIVDFSGYYIDRSRFVSSISDHPMIVTKVLLDERDGAPLPAS